MQAIQLCSFQLILQYIYCIRRDKMSISKKIITIITIFASQIFAVEWIQDGNNYVSSEKLIIKFQNAPLLGIEPPLSLKSRADLQQIISKYGDATFLPTFSNYNEFTQRHRNHDLHHYYNLQFTKSVNVFSLQKELESNPDIEKIEFDFRLSINVIPNDPSYSNQWAHNNTGQASQDGGGSVGTPDCDIGSEQAWDVTTGDEDVIIAILDTGVNSHSEFNGRLLEGYDFINNDTDPSDGNGHGTSCAGISAAQGNNGVGVAGICWDCLILPVKIMSNDGFGEDTQIADGVIWASDNGADVISMSLGGGGFVSYFDNAIDYAVDNGTVVFAASGNDDASTLSYPSRYDNCISIGALSPCNERKTFSSCDGENYWGSNYGTGLDFLAPGVRIHTTTASGGYTTTFNGTSSACPHAAGIAGLILSADQGLSPEGVRTIMQLSAVDIGLNGYDLETGHGRLNAFNALATIVGGPEVNLNTNSITEELASDQTSEQSITVSNSGQMDLTVEIDPFGYYWKDNMDESVDYNWIDIGDENTTITFSHNDEAANEIVNFPFEFTFYEENYSSCIVNANGWIGFADDSNAWENMGLPNTDAPRNAIFPFWDDLNPINEANSTNMDGYVRYHVSDERIVIWYDNVRRWTGGSDMDGYFDFQVVLYPDGIIDFNYRSMTGDTDSATIGIQNESGNSGVNITINQTFVEDMKTVKIKGRPNWLTVSPLNLILEPGATDQINLSFNTTSIPAGGYDYILNLKTNDFHFSYIEIPVMLNVDGTPCGGAQLGDLNSDSLWNILDIILIVNIILYDTEDECEFYIADINGDENINVLDIVLVINLILDD